MTIVKNNHMKLIPWKHASSSTHTHISVLNHKFSHCLFNPRTAKEGVVCTGNGPTGRLERPFNCYEGASIFVRSADL